MANPICGRLSTFLILAIGAGLWSGCGNDGVALGPPGSLQVTTITVGKDPDPDGYSVRVGGGRETAIAVNDVVRIESLPPGLHEIVLGGLTPACVTSEAAANPAYTVVTSGETASVAFEVVCQDRLEDQMALWSWVEGQFSEIFVMDSDGSNRFRLTRLRGGHAPAVSPDGSRILFVSDYRIHVMNANGSGVERLTDGPGNDASPRWSPDGSKIAFSSTRDDPSFDVFVMNADGSEPTNLTGESVGTGATWSPDGSKIAFASARTGDSEILVMNADGSGVVNLTNDPDGSDFAPAWSPDGGRIAYARIGRELTSDIYVMNPDGSNRTALTNHPASDTWPGWSPDGSRIAFTSTRTGDREVFVMNADGTNQLNVSNRPDSEEVVGFPRGWR